MYRRITHTTFIHCNFSKQEENMSRCLFSPSILQLCLFCPLRQQLFCSEPFLRTILNRIDSFFSYIDDLLLKVISFPPDLYFENFPSPVLFHDLGAKKCRSEDEIQCSSHASGRSLWKKNRSVNKLELPAPK